MAINPTREEMLKIIQEADVEFYNSLIKAWNRRQTQLARMKEARKPKKEGYAYYQRGLEYDPEQMTEIEVFRRMGSTWHNQPIGEMTALSWRVMY